MFLLQSEILFQSLAFIAKSSVEAESFLNSHGAHFYTILKVLSVQRCLSGNCNHKTLEVILKSLIHAT